MCSGFCAMHREQTGACVRTVTDALAVTIIHRHCVQAEPPASARPSLGSAPRWPRSAPAASTSSHRRPSSMARRWCPTTTRPGRSASSLERRWRTAARRPAEALPTPLAARPWRHRSNQPHGSKFSIHRAREAAAALMAETTVERRCDVVKHATCVHAAPASSDAVTILLYTYIGATAGGEWRKG